MERPPAMQSSTTRSHSSVRVALRLPFNATEIADYLFLQEVVCFWLGPDAKVFPNLGSDAVLPKGAAISAEGDDSASDNIGRVSELKWPAQESLTTSTSQKSDTKKQPDIGRKFELTVKLDDRSGGGQVSIRISPCARDKQRLSSSERGKCKTTSEALDNCRIRIAQTGLRTEDECRLALKAWQSVVTRLDHLMKQVKHAKRRERQAIIVVHGVGEQRPGQMLREFVKNVFEEDAGEAHFVKPDRLSSLFEMRMVTVPRNDGSRPTTDVYELYWAHLIRDTTLAQVYAWVWRLLWSDRESIPRSLTTLVWSIRIALGIAAAALLWLGGTDVSAWIKGLGISALLVLPAIAKFALSLFNKEFVVGYAGDAARYLEPLAGNIARRQEIKEAGANLLDALHSNGRYARIVVYGHSLGSVIAYDILSHAWTRLSRQRDDVPRTCSRALRQLESQLNPREPAKSSTVDEIQQMQYAAWQEYRRNGFQWRVSDLVTAGSPLAHASWLLNLDSKTRFDDLKQERTLPTCPPQTEEMKVPGPRCEPRRRRGFTFTHAYDDPQRPQAKCSVQVPHHAGLFALTRWTNLYFPYHGLYKGDPIAGPLAAPFGGWVKDVPLRSTDGFAHTRYTDRASEPEAVVKVREALNLSLHRPLAEYM